MAQNYKQEIFKRASYVDLVVGPNDLLSIPFLIKQIVKEKSNALAVNTMEREQDFYISDHRQKKDHAYVVISEGCDNFCSYCVVPFVRGRLHHRHQDDILNEIKKVASSGIKNITLLGQNVNSYKLNGLNFVQLLKEVNSVEGLKEFDFVTSHPKNATKELFLAMRDLGKCRKTLHLPIQSASDRILKLMNRGYTSAHYRKLADLYRKITKGILSTDIIVGFPGETEEDFKKTLGLVKEIEFDGAYLFKYSVRPHTEAENLADDVPKEVKEKRHRILLDLQEEISKRKKSNDK
jgi:tRNA-2-methylthio-N6-dimethylallyladenosine synthase